MTLRKTKVICTLGPAVDDEELIRKLIRAGMDAARFNFSHGDHEEHLQRLNKLNNGGHHSGHKGPGDPHQEL